MKKFFAIMTAVLFSTAVFASKENAPTATDLAGYATGTHTVAVYFETFGDEAPCEGVGIYWTGTVDGWAPAAATSPAFEAVEGFAGWWVVSFTDASESVNGKPICLKKDGSLDGVWDYQTGDPASWTNVLGTEVSIAPGYGGEANCEGWAAGVHVMISAYLKNHGNPCVAAAEHDYHVTVRVEDCAAIPSMFIVGDYNGWGEATEMTLNEDLSYSATIHDQEGHGFKFNDGTWDNQLLYYVAEGDDADTWKDFGNFILGEVTEIVLDFTTPGEFGGNKWGDMVKWTACASEGEAIENVAVAGKAVKAIVNGELILTKNGVVYNILGARK